MHELAIAQALITTVERHLGPHDGAVRCVRLTVGAATGIVSESLDLAFRVAAQGTRLAGTALAITPVPSRSRCPDCEIEFEFDGPLGTCPKCARLAGTLLAGNELAVDSIEVADV